MDIHLSEYPKSLIVNKAGCEYCKSSDLDLDPCIQDPEQWYPGPDIGMFQLKILDT